MNSGEEDGESTNDNNIDDLKRLEAQIHNSQNFDDGAESSRLQEDMEKMLMKSGGDFGGAKDLKNTIN